MKNAPKPKTKTAKKGRDWGKVICIVVLLSFAVPICFLTFRIIFPSNFLPRKRSDYVLMLIQCVLGILAMALPSIVTKRLKIIIPPQTYIVYVLFLYCAIFLGEVQNFYNTVPHWDTILHTFSGVMTGALGFSFVTLLNKEKNLYLQLSPFFVSFFAFCFAVALGTIWEIYEFTFDGLLGLNMQKFALPDGTDLIGRAALGDTMKDLIVDALGALVISVFGYISIKYKKGWLETHLITSANKENADDGKHQ